MSDAMGKVQGLHESHRVVVRSNRRRSDHHNANVGIDARPHLMQMWQYADAQTQRHLINQTKIAPILQEEAR